MQTLKEVKSRLQHQWQKNRFYREYLDGELSFPMQVKLKRPTDKTILYDFAAVQHWQQQLERDSAKHSGIEVNKQQVNFATMGRQVVPVSIDILDVESLARFCGKWQQWQQFIGDCAVITDTVPTLNLWLHSQVSAIVKYAGQWTKLTAIARFFLANPQPNCYIRELKIPDVDSKFIENRKQIIKLLLDEVLPESAINTEYEKVSENGFEQRFGLKCQEPQIRFRLLDPILAAEFGGISDMSIPVSQFAALELFIDRVFITENLTNGLAFPQHKNSIVIFGKGYGIQSLKQVNWLKDCRIYYWGDIDTDGFAILSQIRSYVPNTTSILMDEATLLACKPYWGQESENKKQTPVTLTHLTSDEAFLYQKLKEDHWQPRLRLEQERVPFELLVGVLVGC